MGFRVRIRLFHILHFVRDLLFPVLKNSKSGVDDGGHRLQITHTRRRPFGIFCEDCLCTWHPAFRLQYLLTIISKTLPCTLTSGVAQWVRRRTRHHRVVQGVDSTPSGDVYKNCSSNYFYFSFYMRDQVDFSDIAVK